MTRATSLPLAIFAAAIFAAPLTAQVGHEPSQSPYHDILQGQSWTVLVGNFAGDGGHLGVGPHHGTTYGLRFDIRVSNPVQLGLSVGYATLERLIVDANDSVATRVKGPVKQNVTMIDLAFQWNLTGRKTWHGLAPYFGLGAGLALSGKAPVADTSGYKFGDRAYLAPNIGFRYFVTSRLHIRAEARETFWKLKYPFAYTLEPLKQPAVAPVSNAVITDGKLDEWTGSRGLIVGLGYAISF